MILKIIKDREFLKQISEPVTLFDEPLADLVKDMKDTMKHHRGSVGLSGIQIGAALKIFLLRDRTGVVIVCCNPEILETEKKMKWKEGCLSFPEVMVRMKRHKRIKVQYQDETGKTFLNNFSNLESVIFQHEHDHLYGITIADSIP